MVLKAFFHNIGFVKKYIWEGVECVMPPDHIRKEMSEKMNEKNFYAVNPSFDK